MSRARGRVVVVGSVNWDLVVRVPRLPAPGETVTHGAFARHPGGKGANQAVAAARVGASVAMVCAVGEDAMGEDAVEELRREGVDLAGAVRVPGVATGVAAIVVDEAGENQIAVASGANLRLDGAAVSGALCRREDLSGGVMLAGLEVEDEPVMAAARGAAERGMTLIVNAAPARALPDAVLDARPILTLNAGEGAAIAGVEDPREAARALHERTGAPVVVTLGARGALVHDGASIVHAPAPPATVVDTTGAGDAFTGVLAAELAAGGALHAAVATAQVAAALSVGGAGARSGMPTREQLERAAHPSRGR